MPLSAMAIVTMPPRTRPRTVTVPPSGVNFTALDKKIERDLLERAAVGVQVDAGRELRLNGQALLVGAAPDDAQAVGERAVELDVLGLEMNAAGLDLRHVEDVVDDVEQILAAFADVARVFGVFRARRAGRTSPIP